MVFGVFTGAQFMQPDAFKRFVNASAERIKRKIMSEFNTFADLFQTDPFNGTDRICKILINNVFAYTDSLKQLSGLIRLQSRDAHL